MADTVRKRIVDAVVATLSDAAKPAGLTVHKYRLRPLERDQLPAVVVFSIDESVSLENIVPQVARRLVVRCEARHHGDVPDDALDPILSWVVQRITTDATLQDLTVRVSEVGTEWMAEQKDVVLAAAAVDFAIDYYTLETNPELQ
jgi:hypothetical protein